jgi:AraC-like DNA-binding protein
VAIIAKEAGLSVYQLKSGFQKLFGMTVKQYIFNSKMRVALFLLQTGGKSVKETAILCGYKKYHNFSRAFKKHYQLAPGQIKDDAVNDDMFFTH